MSSVKFDSKPWEKVFIATVDPGLSAISSRFFDKAEGQDEQDHCIKSEKPCGKMLAAGL